jgi:hypothetical protein
MKRFWLLHLPRVILGVIFLAGAIDGFAFVLTGEHLLHPPTAERGLELEGALKETGFFWPFMKIVELIGALCLLTNRAPAFGLAILTPLIAVIVLFHLFLNPQGIPLALVLLLCMALLYRAYAPRYASLFAPGNP